MGRKRAVLVGINYPGTEGELKGCLNDVARMRRCLVDRFGFDNADIRVLADADQSTPPPTGANIRLELERLVGDARPGDTLFFHYSGHGTRLPAETGQDDDTGYDECIVPSDMNLDGWRRCHGRHTVRCGADERGATQKGKTSEIV
jgi:uncharacterized caspase-like protein